MMIEYYLKNNLKIYVFSTRRVARKVRPVYALRAKNSLRILCSSWRKLVYDEGRQLYAI